MRVWVQKSALIQPRKSPMRSARFPCETNSGFVWLKDSEVRLYEDPVVAYT